MKRIYLLLFLLVFFRPGYSQGLSVSVDKQSILIGEQIKLSLEATVPASGGASWLVIDTIPHFEIMNRSGIDSQLVQNRLKLKQVLTLTSWDSGNWKIPPLAWGGSRSGAIPVSVRFTPMDTSQPYHDIHDVLPVKTERPSNWWWYVIGIILLIALFMLFFPGEKVKKEPPPFAMEDVYRNALQRLSKLDPQREPRVVYTDMINIFREYLFKRKNIQSYSKTTEGIAVQIRDLNLPEAQYRPLLGVLQLSDMVKFARYQPSTSETQEAIEVIKNNIVSIEQLK